MRSWSRINYCGGVLDVRDGGSIRGSRCSSAQAWLELVLLVPTGPVSRTDPYRTPRYTAIDVLRRLAISHMIVGSGLLIVKRYPLPPGD